MRKFCLGRLIGNSKKRERLVAEEEAEAEHQSNAAAFMNPMDYEETFTTPVYQHGQIGIQGQPLLKDSSFVCKETLDTFFPRNGVPIIPTS